MTPLKILWRAHIRGPTSRLHDFNWAILEAKSQCWCARTSSPEPTSKKEDEKKIFFFWLKSHVAPKVERKRRKKKKREKGLKKETPSFHHYKWLKMITIMIIIMIIMWGSVSQPSCGKIRFSHIRRLMSKVSDSFLFSSSTPPKKIKQI